MSRSDSSLEPVDATPLSNDDLAPVPPERRNWNKWNIAALWVGMSVCIPTYMLASSLISGGMNWWQAVLTVFLGTLIADYFLVRRTELNVAGLYRAQGAYTYRGGFSLVAIAALVIGVLPNLPGFLGTIQAVENISPFWMSLYHYAWFTGLLLAGTVYFILRKLAPTG